MPDRVFVDTNIWLYSLVQDPSVSGDARHALAFDFLQALSRPVLNSQVMRETCSNLIKKAGFSEERIRRLVRGWYQDCEIHASNANQHLLASELRERHSFSYWDSLIVAAALDAGCVTLYSEDMQHGQAIDGRLTILNPFVGSP
jgi:predicted nucleic acid-binding protein